MADTSDETMGAFGDDGMQLLAGFRQYARTHVEDFKAARDRVKELVSPKQPYLTGVAREDLIRGFLRGILPTSISVDSGVVYGFEKVANSKQIDVLVWDSVHHPAVFRAESFVILAPESVIVAISVKTRSNKADVESTVENLMSLVPLDIGFRETQELKPIAKLAVFYDSPTDVEKELGWLAGSIRSQILSMVEVHDRLRTTLKEIHPENLAQEHKWFVERLFPRLFVHLDGESPPSVIRGWGPPGLTAQQADAQAFPREPYLYQQRSKITIPLEKFAYHVLSEVFRTLNTQGWSIVSAWGDMDPQYHFRVGDAGEIVESTGLPILKPGDL